MVRVLNAEAAEFVPGVTVQVAAASAGDAGGDRRQSGRNPPRARRGDVGSTGQHSRKSAGRREYPSNGGRGVNPVHHERKKWNTRRDGVHPQRNAHAAEKAPGGAESASSAQHSSGRRGDPRWVKAHLSEVSRKRLLIFAAGSLNVLFVCSGSRRASRLRIS